MSDEGNSSGFKNLDGEKGTSVLEKLIQVRMSSGKIYGPYKRSEVLIFIRKGKIKGEEEILVEGDSNWKPVSSDMEFFDELQKALLGEDEEPKEKKKSRKSRDKRTKTIPLKRDGIELGEKSQVRSEKTEKFVQPSEGKSSVPEEIAPVLQKSPPARGGHIPSTSYEFKSTPKKEKNKKLNPIFLGVVAVLALAAVAGYFYQFKSSTRQQYSGAFRIQSNRFYARHIVREMDAMPKMPEGPVPNLTLSKSQQIVAGWGAHQWISDMVKLSEEKDASKKQESSYWFRWAWDLMWTASALQAVDANVARAMASRATEITAQLKKQKILSIDYLNLLDAILLFDEGKWAEIENLLAGNATSEGEWLREEARWLKAWQSGETYKSEGGELSMSSGEFWALSQQIRSSFYESSTSLFQAEEQLAELDPLSYHLWFSAAQFFWIRNTSNVERSMRFFLVGFSSLSLYPLPIQAVFWDQFFKYQSAHGRKELAEKSLQNIELIKNGEAYLSAKSHGWWDLGEDGLDIKAAVEQIYQKVRTSRSELVDLAALSVLGPVAPEGSLYMTEVAYRAAFDKNWERARQIFSQIVQKEPRNILALGGKMWAESNLYLFDDATDDLAAIGKSNPQNGEYDRYRGMLLSIARDYDEAEKVLTDHIKSYPTDAWSYFFLAQMKEGMEKNYDCTSNAAKARLHAEGELKQRADLLYYRCGIKAGIGVKEALAELEKLEADSPNDISIQLEHIEALINSKKLGDAVTVARAYVERSPRSYDLRVKLGDVYVLRGDFDRAVAFYNSAVASRPRSAEAFIKIAKVLDELKRFPEAAQNYEAAALAQPTYPEVYLQAARAYVKLRNPPKAADMYVRELKARPSSVTTFMEAAEFFLIVQAPKEVPKIYAMVAEEFQQDPGVLVRLAQAYLGLQDYEKARLNAANAAAGAPKMPEAQRILGESFEALGNYEAARSHYELYLRLFPEAPDADDIRRKLSNAPFSN